MNKNIWIVANWKSNKTVAEALEWISLVGSKISRQDNVKVVVCPTDSALSEVAKAVKVGGYPILVGAQNLSPFGVGSYTGEEAGEILKQFVGLSIIGHSERRTNFSETDEMVSSKVKRAVESEIMPLVCVQNAETPVPSGVKVIAYEPVFAIGTGNPDTAENADKVAKSLRSLHGEELQVLYGGSVNSENCKGFVEMENISGLLIGKASLDAEEFVKILNSFS